MRGMRFLMHAIVIAGFFLGSDHVANDGAETARLIREMQLRALWNDVKMQNYHVAAELRREVYTYRPGLVLARID